MLIGTAGQIDHGKTALIKRLTGRNTDRLPEEIKRGISIELGYAYVPLEARGDVLGFIDVPGHERFVHTMLAGAPLLAVLFAAQAAAAPFPAPDCSALPGWTQQGASRSYDAETLFDYMNGNSEGYFAYGFTLMKGVTCVNAGGDQLVIVSEMGDPDGGWGFFVTNRDQRSPVETIGSAGQVPPRRATFAKGRHYVEIAASPDKGHREALRAFVTALEARVPGDGRAPEAVAWFPGEGLEPGSIRLVPESVLGLRVLRTASWRSTRRAARSSCPRRLRRRRRPRWRS